MPCPVSLPAAVRGGSRRALFVVCGDHIVRARGLLWLDPVMNTVPVDGLTPMPLASRFHLIAQ